MQWRRQRGFLAGATVGLSYAVMVLRDVLYGSLIYICKARRVAFKSQVQALLLLLDSQATATDRCNIEVNCDSVNSIGDNMNHAPIPQSASNACFSTEKHNTNPQCPLLFALHRETMPKDTLLFTVLKSNKANNRCKALTEVGQLVI